MRQVFVGSAVTMVSFGGLHTMEVTEVGRFFTFGYEGYCQLGKGRRDSRCGLRGLC